MTDDAIIMAGQHLAAGRLPQAEAIYRQVLARQPNHCIAGNNLGVILARTGRSHEAIAAWRQILLSRPDYAEAYNNIGHTLTSLGRFEEAAASLRQAVAIQPEYAEGHNNLGVALMYLDQFDSAVAAFRTAARYDPRNPHSFNNLGNCLKDCGRMEEAIASYRRALELAPHNAAYDSNLVYTLHFCAAYDGPSILRELRRWNAVHAEPLKGSLCPHDNEPAPDRRLRIGYVSSDFRQHVVGQNLLPLLRGRDRRALEVFCYSNVLAPDAVTAQIRRQADVWREIAGLDDEQAAQLIRNDRIDILIDLALHSGNNRLLIFARKPAPVQATYLGYCGSTGLQTMDYRLSDPHLDPPDADLSCYTEQTIRLARTYWCYLPPDVPVTPSPPPALQAGYITFGCLNNFAKVSPDAMNLWAEILRSLAQSRLLLHVASQEHVNRVRQHFMRAGVEPQRIEFVHKQHWAAYAQTYARIDIALDPFPYGGGITTFDALWMGVPVVTLSGNTAVGRGGRSILCNLDLPELVAYSPEQYKQIAIELAGDLPRLTELHAGMRQRMLASPLMDANKFARDVEAAYRQMWQRWCNARG